MGRGLRIGVAGVVAAASLSVAPWAAANDDDVIREGACSGSSDWKLKLSPENGNIEVEFEVDQNEVGDEWRVVMRHEGEVFFRGKRTTQGPSGSFEVRRVEDDLAGTDSFRARARNLDGDEVCRGRASFDE